MTVLKLMKYLLLKIKNKPFRCYCDSIKQEVIIQYSTTPHIFLLPVAVISGLLKSTSGQSRLSGSCFRTQKRHFRNSRGLLSLVRTIRISKFSQQQDSKDVLIKFIGLPKNSSRDTTV
jgi:hypothetical protein